MTKPCYATVSNMYDSGSAPLDSQKIVLSEISRILGVASTQLHLKSNFIRNGGDSFSAIQLQAALRKRGIQIGVVSILQCCDLIHLATDCTRARDRPLLGNGSQIRKAQSSDNTPLAKRRRRRSSTTKVGACKQLSKCIRYPMTEMQTSLVVSTKANPGRNVIEYIETHRPDNIPALKAAWEEVLALEPIFRMSFEVDESGGFMYEGDRAAPFVWEETVVDTESSYQRKVEMPLEADLCARAGSTFKVVTLQGAECASRSTVIWRVHHARIDGTSFTLLRDKVRRVVAGGQVQAGPSFATIALQLQTLQMQGAQAAAAFWAQVRKDDTNSSQPTRLLLPAPDPPDDAQVLPMPLGKVWIHPNHDKLSAHAQAAGVTVASLYYAAWALVLATYSDSEHVCFGAVLCGRSLPIADIMSVVGPTINTLPLHVSVDPGSTVESYTRKVFASLLDLTTFQYSIPDHGFIRNFSSAVNIRFHTLGCTDAESDWIVEEPYSRVRSDFPIHVEVGTNGRICIEYNTEVFFEAHMQRLGASFADALDAMLDSGSSVGSCLECLVGGTRRIELARMGNWASELTRPSSITDDLTTLFSQAAEKHPSVVAVEHGSCVLTYGELDEKSSAVAGHLSEFVRLGDVVGVHADSTINWIVGIYGVLKAGATCCPFDQQLPDVARDANFTASGAQVFLTGSSAAKSRKPESCRICLSVEELLLLQDTPADNGPRNAKPSSVAYLCFTSGSTGKPKGVMCRHDGLVAFQKDFRVRLCARPGWRIAQFMSLGFDGSIHEIFSALSYGSTLVLKDYSKPFSHLRTCDAVILTSTVSQALDPAEYPNLRAVYLVGEVVPQSVCDAWACHRQLFNMYGPTEATCGATIKALFPNQPVTIGVPCSSVRIYLLDSRQRVVPWGVVGEICLAGVQVSRGYIGRPDETARRFVPDHINPQYKGEHMYKTGDRAYWNEQGELVFLGRNDRQVKLKGFRIDLDDLEIRIPRASKNCAAAAVAMDANNDHLVALVQPSGLDLKELGSELRRHVPSYAIPHHIAAVDIFPMTPAGKVDYKCIAATESSSFETICSAPKAATVTVVKTALRDSLQIPGDMEIDLQSSFSDLGGDSLLAIAFSNRLSQSLKQQVSARLILETATIQDLAEALDSDASRKLPAMAAAMDDHNSLETSVLGQHALSPIERYWWQRYQCGGDTSSFNVTYACQLSSTVNLPKLVEAWNCALSRHLILRCRYACSKEDLSEVVRRYSPNPPSVREVQSISLDDEVNNPFNLMDQDADLIRVSISATHMLIVVSHIICDLTTLQSLLLEVADTYNDIQRPLINKKTYFQATTWSKPAAPQNLSFWSDYLADAPRQSLCSVGGSGNGSAVTRKPWSGSSYACEIPRNIYQDALLFSSHNKVTMHQLGLAAVALALQPTDSGTCDITLGAPYLNRDSKEDLQVIGLFVEPLPIRIRYPWPPAGPGKKSSSFVKAVQDSSRAALSHVVPWDQLMSHLCIDKQRSYPSHPLFDTMVTFHGAAHEVRLPIDGVRFLPTWAQGAKFKIMAEFTARSTGALTLRLECSDEFLDRDDVRVLARLIVEAFRGLTAGESYDAVLGKVMRIRADYATHGRPQVDDGDPLMEITVGSATAETTESGRIKADSN
ncbi:BcNRPS1, nonribosomal peptide synthetase [Diaporthe sp. PMI_573]|nr:BcNRPS1, nonribosomal peptide synthetase [Diaporthaceae sp. PMI_573]